ncbi:MAG: hypothetical protein K2X07_00190 [Caulobacteraceae bacterium]|nr:hypothetical protein [Caulobacteraceae bacterium]
MSSSRSEIREAWIRLVEELNPTMAVTLGSGLNCTAAPLNRDAKRFCCALERKVLGAAWSEKPSDERMTAIGFHEHPSSNRHMHLAVAAPFAHEGRLMTDGNRLWRKMRSCGDFYCEPIENVAAYARYITKDVGLAYEPEDIFIYVPRPRPKW